jgi:hypothetical protein
MDAAGFQPPEKPQGPPPEEATSSSTSSTSDVPEYITDFLDKQESGSVTEEDINALIQSLLSAGQTTQGSIVDQKV